MKKTLALVSIFAASLLYSCGGASEESKDGAKSEKLPQRLNLQKKNSQVKEELAGL